MGNLSSSSTSILPEDLIAILIKGMREGFEDGWLNLSNKKINDSMMPELCEWIIKLGDKVNILDLSGNKITSVGASMLFDTLQTNNSSINKISLSYNMQIDNKCIKTLGEYIKSNRSIQIIWLSNSGISNAGIEIFAPYLDGNTAFKQLYLSDNKEITDKSIPLLMKMVESSHIEYISIDSTSITQKNTIYSLLGCKRIKIGLTRLQLYYKELNDDNLIKICESMKKYGINRLKEIHLHNNKITSKGASVLFDTLKECNSVVSHLNLSYNQLDDECMKQLSEYLHYNEHLGTLRLGSNKITDKCIEILSEYLIGNTILKQLHLDSNEEITDASVPHIIEMVNKSCITNLNVDYTSISEESQQEIKKALSIPIEQREIPIKSNTKSAAKIQSSSASTSIKFS